MPVGVDVGLMTIAASGVVAVGIRVLLNQMYGF